MNVHELSEELRRAQALMRLAGLDRRPSALDVTPIILEHVRRQARLLDAPPPQPLPAATHKINLIVKRKSR